MNYEWSKQEEFLLQRYYPKMPIDRLAEMLPNRSRGAIEVRARMLGLKKERNEEVKTDSKTMDAAKSLEQLKTQVAVKQAQLDIESTQQALTIFDEQMVSGFTGNDTTPEDFVKLFAAKRSKMVAAWSRAKLKLAMARMSEKMV